MGCASERLAHLRCGLRAGAPARGSAARRHRGGDPGVVVRGTRHDSILGLRRRPGLRRLPRGAKHHSRHSADDLPEMADVPDLDRAVIFFATGLGFALARWKVLPGTTAVWGSSPG